MSVIKKWDKISRRVRACDYLSVAQLFLMDNFLLERPLEFSDIKPRLLGHWGTCHGINVAYANLQSFYLDPSASLVSDNVFKPKKNRNFSFVLGPGHGFPALQANLFIDEELQKVDKKVTNDQEGIAYLCRSFSWPGGFPSHASPATPGVICEGGELGYALGTAFGYVLGHPERTVAVMLGDGELETATALSSLNLVKLLGDHSANGRVIPILHLNGYKISAPTIYGRKSERELNELIRGFGYTPFVTDEDTDNFQFTLGRTKLVEHPFIVLKSEKGATGPRFLNGKKVAGNFLSHQIPLQNAKTSPEELQQLEEWLQSYKFSELLDKEKGWTL